MDNKAVDNFHSFQLTEYQYIATAHFEKVDISKKNQYIRFLKSYRLKHWIYILLFLSLHSCKLNFIGSNSNFLVSASKFLEDGSFENLNDDNSDNGDSSKKSTSCLNLFIDSEEEEEEDKASIIALEHSVNVCNGYNTVSLHHIYYPRDLPDKHSVPIYIFCNTLII